MSVTAKKGRTFTPYYRNEKPLTVQEVEEFPMLAVPQQDILKEDAEFVEETLLSAIQEAAQKAKDTSEEAMAALSGGMGGFPGLM